MMVTIYEKDCDQDDCDVRWSPDFEPVWGRNIPESACAIICLDCAWRLIARDHYTNWPMYKSFEFEVEDISRMMRPALRLIKGGKGG